MLLPELADLPLTPAGPASDLTGGAGAGLPGFTPRAAFSPPHGAAKRAVGAAFADWCGVAAPVAPPAELAAVLAGVARDGEALQDANRAYGAALGFYNSCVLRRACLRMRRARAQ